MIDVVESELVIVVNQLDCVNNLISYFGCLTITNSKELNDIEFNKPLQE